MKLIKKLLTLLVLLLCLFIGLWIAQDNPEQVKVTLLGFGVEGGSLGLWLLVALLSGVVLGMLASLPLLVKQAAQRRKIQKQLIGNNR